MMYHSHQEVADDIEREIVHRGALLGIDWANEAQVEQLAYDAFYHARDVSAQAAHAPDDVDARIRAELYGLAALMLRTMEDGANVDVLIHGGVVWKSFGRALWTISQQASPIQTVPTH